MLRLTKSDFLAFLQCDKALWLRLRDPDVIDWPAPTEFNRMLMADGYAVEQTVQAFVATWGDCDLHDFQTIFESDDGLYARADMVRRNPDGTVDLWEIKASTRLTPQGADHVIDAAFQTLVAERAGETVNRIGVIHVNGDYVAEDVIDPASFLIFHDVTDEVRTRLAAITQQAGSALALLSQNEINRTGCGCRIKTKSQHCAAFSYFNPDVPASSIYDIPRLSAQKRTALVNAGRLSLAEMDTAGLSPLQHIVVEAAQSGAPVIDPDGIRTFLDELTYPLYFYDYETFGSAIPNAPGLKPHEQIPVQISLHILAANGTLSHHEHLTEAPGQSAEIPQLLQAHIGRDGNLISWNASFEKSCNQRLARLYPGLQEFLAGLNARTRDLMDVFKLHYVDPRFGGSTSIKKVLPVLVPDLLYDPDSVHDGTGAMDAWKRLVESADAAERSRLRSELLAYCELDTRAMVEILSVLKTL
eukprot:TRINITY_DN8693_c0_g1_i1.p2 TRINITY_DN8693_c0_g1~~TRINITY_DN8693_c0_g1_i1.p2  ORF type:complete len:472 (-),score=65.13 TRINITY_DN8693_c0_g1_i1:4906-6321(-)